MNGPIRTFALPSRFCGCSLLTGHSARVRNLEMIELTVCGTKRPFRSLARVSAFETITSLV